jgi:hypothetical protein
MSTELYAIKIPGTGSPAAKTAEYCVVDLSESKILQVREMVEKIARAEGDIGRSMTLYEGTHIGIGAGPERKALNALIGEFKQFLKPELTQSGLERFEGDVGAFGWGKRITDAEKFAVTAMIVRWQMLRNIRRDD